MSFVTIGLEIVGRWRAGFIRKPKSDPLPKALEIDERAACYLYR